jgi:hypothetical protein
MAAQLVQFLGRDAPPVGQQNLGGAVGEQVGGQCERADAGELVGLLADTLQTCLTRARAQCKQRSATDFAARCVGGGSLEQGIESGGCLRRQARQNCRAQRFLVPVHNGAHRPVEAIGGWRLDAERSAPFACCYQQPIRSMLQRGHLAFEPAREGLGIVQRGLAKAEGVADLCPVIRDGSAAPIVAAPGCGGYADLTGDCLDRCDGDFLRSAWKPPLGLKHLEQHGEAQPRGAGLVAEQHAVRHTQRPTIVDILTCLVDHSCRLRCGTLSQSGCSLFCSTDGPRNPGVRAVSSEGSLGTAEATRRLSIAGSRPPISLVPVRNGTSPRRARRLRGGRHLQGDGLRRAAGSRGAAQGHGARPGAANRTPCW